MVEIESSEEVLFPLVSGNTRPGLGDCFERRVEFSEDK